MERARCDDECELNEACARATAHEKIKIMLRPVDVGGPSSSSDLLTLLRSKEATPQEEKTAMDRFLLQHAQRYDFSSTESGATSEGFGEIFRLLIAQRFLMSHHWDRLAAQPPVTPRPNVANSSQATAAAPSPSVAASPDGMWPRDYLLRVLQCMRVLMRDPAHRSLFSELGGATVLVRLFWDLSEEHSTNPHAEFASEMLVEALSILKRFASLEELCPAPPDAAAASAGVLNGGGAAALLAGASADSLRLQRGLVALLSTREALILQCVLVAIQQFVQMEPHLRAIGQLGCAELMLRILADYEASFKVLAAELIELLLRERTFFKDAVLHDGTSAILSALHSDDVALQLPLLRSLEMLASRPEVAVEIRQLGGINILVNLLGVPSCAPHVAEGICAVLTTLALDDEAALQIRKENAVYKLGKLLLMTSAPPAANAHASASAPAAAAPAALVSAAPDGAAAAGPAATDEGIPTGAVDAPSGGGGGGEAAPARPPPIQLGTSFTVAKAAGAPQSVGGVDGGGGFGGAMGDGSPSTGDGLTTHIFRALRFIFSTERNRKIFRRLFPPDLFAAFIDVGHYARDLGRYAPLALQLRRLSAEGRARMTEALEDINVIKGPARHYVREYAVQELLGKGAFGSVYQVKKDRGETLFAMKELPLEAVGSWSPNGHGGSGGSGGSPGGGDGQQPAAHLKREVQILSGLSHPNIIHYYESFVERSSLYIVMELVDGATLLDHLNSLAEKGQAMAEQRIWTILTQTCLALRYIHKEKHVVHRDLTPSNILLTTDNVVKLADFGLARQRVGTNSVFESVVGTVLYQCPEIIQNEAYGEKADIWALGCILYQMATLRPPFEGGNPLVVARTIVEGSYRPLGEAYPPGSLLAQVVSRLLTVEPDKRPDIDAVSTLISPVLLAELGRVSKSEHSLRAEVAMEREWRQRHEKEAKSNKEAVHRLFARHHILGNQRGGGRGGGRGAVLAAAAAAAAASGGVGSAECGGGNAAASTAAAGGSGAAAGGVAREPVEPSPLRRSVPSRGPMLSISPSRMREISDPCSLILNQLHKILFIAQLPPSLAGAHHAAGAAAGDLTAERHVIERYKRELFSHRNHYRGRRLKDELHKVMSGSQEMIDLVAFRTSAAAADRLGAPSAQQRISYEELQRSIEHVLEATGYYALQADEQQQQQASVEAAAAVAPPPPPPGIERAASLPTTMPPRHPPHPPPTGAVPLAAAPGALPPVRPPAGAAPSRGDLPLAS